MTAPGTISWLIEHEHELHAHCGSCDRWRKIDLERFVMLGEGDRHLPVKVRWSECARLGVIQVRPVMPKWGNARGGVMPPTHGVTAQRDT